MNTATSKLSVSSENYYTVTLMQMRSYFYQSGGFWSKSSPHYMILQGLIGQLNNHKVNHLYNSQTITRMHSSRMCTGCSLTVWRGVLLAGGSPCWGVSLPGGLLARGVLLAGGLPAGGILARGSPCQGVGGLLGGGFSLLRPPVNRMTDTCKNITLATTSLRPVTMGVI